MLQQHFLKQLYRLQRKMCNAIQDWFEVNNESLGLKSWLMCNNVKVDGLGREVWWKIGGQLVCL